jgi:hypothetical protein
VSGGARPPSAASSVGGDADYPHPSDHYSSAAPLQAINGDPSRQARKYSIFLSFLSYKRLMERMESTPVEREDHKNDVLDEQKFTYT